jgi:hypothetical protein
MARLYAFRARWAGTIQDVCSAIAMLAFLGGVGFWLAVMP